MRQLLKDFDRTLRDATSACHCEDHGCESSWHSAGSDVVSEAGQSILHCVVVQIHVRAADEEGSLELFLQKELSNSSDEVEGASDTSVSAECN